MRTIVAIGATSSIVASTLQCFAGDGDQILIAGRDEHKLNAVSADLISRGASRVEIMTLDLSAKGAEQEIYNRAMSLFPQVEIVYLGYGTLTDTKRAEQDTSYALSELHNNFNSAAAHCLVWARYLESKQKGTIAVISSVAGDRGRQSNYIYGAAKGGLTIFLSGLRNRLCKFNVGVVTIKPGFIDTPMTSSIKKGPLFASSEAAGRIIYRGICAKRDVIYVPGFWSVIMSIICAIPERIFKKLSL